MMASAKASSTAGLVAVSRAAAIVGGRRARETLVEMQLHFPAPAGGEQRLDKVCLLGRPQQ